MQIHKLRKAPLSETHPEIAKQLHLIQNGNLTAEKLTAGSEQKVWWQCSIREDHVWSSSVYNRAGGPRSGCPYCSGHKVAFIDSLAHLYPQLAKELDENKNKFLAINVKPNKGSKKAFWVCARDSSHKYEMLIRTRVSHFLKNIHSCPRCNSLAIMRPDLAAQLHPDKNGILTAFDLPLNSHKEVWWQCAKNPKHEWISKVDNRNKGRNCPECGNKRANSENSLAALYPAIAVEFHPTRNQKLTIHNIVAGSGKEVWWQCQKDKTHIWKAAVELRTKRNYGCPYCNSGWTIGNIRLFVASLLPFLDKLTEAELYVLFQQNGLLGMASHVKGRSFIQAFKTGKFPIEELKKFVNNETSLVDKFLENPNQTLENINANTLSTLDTSNENMSARVRDFFTIETKDVLASLDNKIFANLDKEAVEFFIASAIAKLWQHAFMDENKAHEQLHEYNGDGLYPLEVKRRFLTDYEVAKNLTIPKGYNFPHQPNLMQRYTAHLVKSKKRIGNWSGTGAGKTLSAILASRVINAPVTIICCPNNVIENWEKDIKSTYPDSAIYINNHNVQVSSAKPTYLILNYDFFQQPKAQIKLTGLLEQNFIDFIILDEIHFAKQREEANSSKRKKLINFLLVAAAKKNDKLHVLGMSATPVLNNLFEGKTLIELVTGIKHHDLKTQGTQSNCISLYQKFILYGMRWVPDYGYKKPVMEYINANSYIPEIIKNSISGSLVNLEAVLTRAKIPAILKNLIPKTVVYTHFRQDIEQLLRESIEQQGWRVALFNGDTKEGLARFLNNEVDILIATSCIGTGIDGLQKVAKRLIINCLPWTHAEYKQLAGRFYRQGQINDDFQIFIPMAYIEHNGERKSRCEDRWKYIEQKRSLADAAVDGVIVENKLNSRDRMYDNFNLWIQRLERGEIYEVEREKISSPLLDDKQALGSRKLGDLTLMNQQINNVSSEEAHQRFLNDPQEFFDYHRAYAQARKEWDVIPFQEAIKWLKIRANLVVGDFGCGEAFLAKELTNTVYSFDHVAVNEQVVACDMSHVPLEDGLLDVIVFSLSLMGTNFVDYLLEAKRCLRLDGHLWIAEPASRIQNVALFEELLGRIGFNIYEKNVRGKFMFILAIKSGREVNQQVIKSLTNKNILN